MGLLECFLSDPCTNYNCSSKPYSTCKTVEDKAACVCPEVCPFEISLVCGSDGLTYDNECQMRRAACQKPAMITVSWKGHCGKLTYFAVTEFLVSGTRDGMEFAIIPATQLMAYRCNDKVIFTFEILSFMACHLRQAVGFTAILFIKIL